MRFLRQSVRRASVWVVAVLLAIGGAASEVWAERPSAGHLLPVSTLGVVSIVNAPDLAQRFMNTAIGKMSQDPQLKPLVSHLYGSLSNAVAEVQDRIGVSLPELLSIPQGELTLALVAAKDAPPAVVVLLDTGDQISNARKLLEKGTTALEQSGAKKTEEIVAGTKLTTYEGLGPGQPKAVYFEKDATLVAGTDPEVLKQFLAVWSGQKAATLSDNEHYAAIMNRCKGGRDESPQVLWFVDPVAIMRAFGEQNARMRLAIAVLPALGLDSLSGLGGTLAFDAGQFDTISHAHLLLEAPRSGVLKMLALRSGDTKPERWVPADVATYTTLHWNVETTYKSLATVYDSFRGEGALGKWMELQFLGATGIDRKSVV